MVKAPWNSRYNDLSATGLEAFTRKWDPCWDVPLNESLPEPVIELPVVLADADQQLKLEL
jgi:hypothetical protein